MHGMNSSGAHSKDKVARVKSQVKHVSALMEENLQTAMERGEAISSLTEKTSTVGF